MTQAAPHQFDVPDMDCSGCVASIERAVHKLDAAATVDANLTTKRVVVDSAAATADIKAAIEGAGYDVKTAA
ncbi:MAG: heavy metal-associated domain-containing protein [Acidocella sp.]|nr:heavy metal-associated domain-containing protein [Acidocella sp.]